MHAICALSRSIDCKPKIIFIGKIKEYRETKPRGGRAMTEDKYKYFHDNIDNKLGPLDLDFVPLKDNNRKDKKNYNNN